MPFDDVGAVAKSVRDKIARRRRPSALLVLSGEARLVRQDEAEEMLSSGQAAWEAVAGFYSGSVPAAWIEDDLRSMAGQ